MILKFIKYPTKLLHIISFLSLKLKMKQSGISVIDCGSY